jgi:hypothetical protein
MQDEPDDEILATVAASAGRRFLGIGMLALLGVMVIYVALTNPPALGWQVFLLAFGTIALMVADAMRRATAFRLELTREELRDTGGEVIARVAEIKSVDRGAFAFKPSNGFLLRTSTPAPRRWRPGLWWRIGARIGVGGMTPGRQTRNMAEIIAIMIAERDQAT